MRRSVVRSHRLHRLSRFATLLFALLALVVVSCGVSIPPMCTNCMTDPVDNDQGFRYWCGTQVPTPGPPCTRVGFLFRGYVDSPNIPITIEAKLPDSTLPDPWWKVEDVTSDSKNGPPYGWGKWVNLDYGIWEVTQGPVPASVMYSASVRSKSPGGPLASLKHDKYICYNANPTAFLANCTTGSPVAHITAVADFGNDAVNLINLIRRQEGVTTELKEFDQKESIADQDAKVNYEHMRATGKAHYHMDGVLKDQAPAGMGQNETATRDTYDQILDIDIWLQMYVYEKQYHNTGTCDEPAVCKSDGHYLAMISPAYTKVAPGIHVTPNKEFHAVLNFYP